MSCENIEAGATKTSLSSSRDKVFEDGAISPLNLDILASKRQLAPLLKEEGAFGNDNELN